MSGEPSKEQEETINATTENPILQEHSEKGRDLNEGKTEIKDQKTKIKIKMKIGKNGMNHTTLINLDSFQK